MHTQNEASSVQESAVISLPSIDIQNQTQSSLYSNMGWYARQFAKGVTVLGLGVLGYSWLRSGSKGKEDVSSEPVGETGLTKRDTDQVSFRTNNHDIKLNKASAIAKTFSQRSVLEMEKKTAQNEALDIEYPKKENPKSVLKSERQQITKRMSHRRGKRFPGFMGGNEFQVNSYTNMMQARTTVAGLTDGSFVVTWDSQGQDGSSFGIYGRHYAADGTSLGGEFQINTYTASSQMYPSVTSLTDGAFVVIWESYQQDGSEDGVYGQLYNSTTDRVGSEFRVNTYTPGRQAFPSVTGLTGGGFVVVWLGMSFPRDGAYGQLYTSAGVKWGSEFQVNNYSNGIFGEDRPCVAGLTDGSFVVTSYGGRTQQYTAAGVKLRSGFSAGVGSQYSSVAALTDGGFVVTAQAPDGLFDSETDIYGQRFNASGAKLGSRFEISTNTQERQEHPSVAGLIDGGFVVAWHSNWYSRASWSSIYGQRFDASGAKLGSEYQVNTYSADSQRFPSVAGLIDGRFVVTWQSFDQDGSNDGIFGRLFTEGLTALNVNQTVTYIEDTPYNSFASIGVFTPESAANVNITLSNPNAGNLTTGTWGTVTSTYSALTGFWQASGTPSDIRALLAQLAFIPVPDSSLDFSMAVRIGDGSSSPIEGTVVVNGVAVNDKPVLGNNTLTVNEGETVVLTGSNLSATDVDNVDATLRFAVSSSTQHGQFEFVSNPGNAIIGFTQQQITSGTVQFVHDGGEIAPSYSVYVNDGSGFVGPSSAGITFSNNVNDVPVLLTNAMTLNEGETVTVTASHLSATDIETNDSALTFTISNLLNGQFEWVSNPGNAITSFTQQQITDAAVRFVHFDNGFEDPLPPSYDVVVSDGTLMSSPSSAVITYTPVNNMPVLEVNKLSIVEGQKITLKSGHLNARDKDNAVRDLVFKISNIKRGQFERVDAPGAAITSFSQGDVSDSKIVFTHDDSSTKPSYEVSVSDGQLTTSPQSATITFRRDAKELATGVGVGVGVPVVALLTGGAVAGILLTRRKRGADRRTRETHALADRIRHHLRLSGCDNFAKGKGAAFVVAVEGLERYVSEEKKGKKGKHHNRTSKQLVVEHKGLVHHLEDRGIDVREMEGEALDRLAQDVALVIAKKLPSHGLFAKHLTVGIEQLMPRLARLAHNVKKLRKSRIVEIEKNLETSVEMQSVSLGES